MDNKFCENINNSKKSFNKRLKILLSLLVFVIGIISAISIVNNKVIKENEDKKEYLDKISKVTRKDTGVFIAGIDFEFNKEFDTDTGHDDNNGVFIDNFSINNIFGFTNFGTILDTKGDCLGISLTEKEYYLKSQEGISITGEGQKFGIGKNKDLTDFRGSQQYFYQLNPSKDEPSSTKYLKEGFKVIDNIVSLNRDTDFDKVIKTIIYYQDIGPKEIPSTSFSPEGKFLYKKYECKYNKQESTPIDIKVITDRIDKNEPIVIGLNTFDLKPNNGHAILGYGYEYGYDENDKSIETLKVYVIDSNVVPVCYQKKGKIIDAQSFITFSKIDGVWQYNYNKAGFHCVSKGSNKLDEENLEIHKNEYNTEIVIF